MEKKAAAFVKSSENSSKSKGKLLKTFKEPEEVKEIYEKPQKKTPAKLKKNITAAEKVNFAHTEKRLKPSIFNPKLPTKRKASFYSSESISDSESPQRSPKSPSPVLKIPIISYAAQVALKEKVSKSDIETQCKIIKIAKENNWPSITCTKEMLKIELNKMSVETFQKIWELVNKN